MANILEESNNELVTLDYNPLIERILGILKTPQDQPFWRLSSDQKKLIIGVDNIAFQVAESGVESPLGIGENSAKTASVNFSQLSQAKFIKNLQKLRDFLQEDLQKFLDSQNLSFEEYLNTLLKPLSTFQGTTKNQLSLVYPFGVYTGLEKQRLTVKKENSQTSPLLRFHRVTITINNLNNFKQALKESLASYIDLQFANEDEDNKEDLKEILEDLVNESRQTSDFYRLIELLNKEALGRLQREAKIRYLEFILEQINEHPDVSYLEDLIRRLRLLENYINDPNKADGDYEVNYAGIMVNYRDLFNRADAFNSLPIIPLIEGYLGEVKKDDEGKKECTFGLKLKLAGSVQTADGQPSLDYHLNFLDSNSQAHQDGLSDELKKKFFVEKVLRITLLYYFIFVSRNSQQADLDYNPIIRWESDILPILKSSNDSQKTEVMGKIKEGLRIINIEQKVNKLKNILTTFLKRKTLLPSREYPISLSIEKGILEKDYQSINDNSSFFKTVLHNNSKEALKYLSIGESTVNPNALCSLNVNLRIDDLQYYSTGETQEFSMEYDLRKIQVLPAFFLAKDERCRKIYGDQFGNYNLIVFPYDHQNLRQNIYVKSAESKRFIYQVTFALLVYVSLSILIDKISQPLFLPIIRFHLKSEEATEEKQLRDMLYVISHLLNEKNRSNCQGFNILSLSQFKIQNGLASLYGNLPKVFRFNNPNDIPSLDKLAIIVVSSRESDRIYNNDYKIANVFGEIVGIYRQPDNSIRLYTHKTFSGNYEGSDIYTHPTVLIDAVTQLYNKGYRHFLYIAKSPYTSTLNLTQTNEDEELYFMSPSIIRTLKGNREDMKIYPIFFDQYYTVKLADPKVKSLYIQDTLELTNIAKDPHKRSVVFFNLFNGRAVGNDKQYRGVISYTTLLNFYEGILDDTDIHVGLINESSLKQDLLQYLTLYHFSRYEKTPTQKDNISLKLNPYQRMIGDESLSKLSIFDHFKPKIKFNLLAFLTEVRRALNIQPENS